ncbi:MAG: hypothetical protein ACJA2N_001727, partial [Salibacteraceae bacterium]
VVNKNEVYEKYGIKLCENLPNKNFQLIIKAVSHKIFQHNDSLYNKSEAVFFDVKSML